MSCRPRKIVLLYCQDEDERPVLAFLLELRGYRVIGGISSEPPIPDVAVVVDDRSLATVAMAAAIREKLPTLPILVLSASGVPPSIYPDGAVMMESKSKPANILEWVRMLAQKKRGPQRSMAGENNPAAKLCRSQVLAIRAMKAEGFIQAHIARHFNVRPERVSSIVCGRTWA